MDLHATLRFDHQLLAVESEHSVHCMLELTAPPAPDEADRPPLHIALVLDRSGSMAGEKLDSATRCAAFLARRLRPTDELSVVTFDNEVRLDWPFQPIGTTQAQLAGALRAIHPGGATNLSGGWLKGVEQLGQATSPGPKKIILLTDGLANEGITDPDALAKMARGAAEERGIGTTTIGFGEGFDEDLLTAMADQAGGNAYYAETPDEAPAIFAQEFEGLASIVAQNVSVEIRPTEQVQVVGVLNDYSHQAVPGGVQIQLGDAYGEEARRVVFELSVPALDSLGPATIAEVVLRYVTVGQEVASHEVRVPVTVNLVAADDPAAAELDSEVVEEVVVLKSARVQENARGLALSGDFEQARKLLTDTADELRRIAPGSARAEELIAQADEAETFGQAIAMGSFDTSMSKSMHYSSWQRHRGRPRKPEPDSQDEV